MLAEIMATLKAIQSIAEALKAANEMRKEQMEKHELKQIEEFKEGVRIELERIKNAKNDNDRRIAIGKLGERLSK